MPVVALAAVAGVAGVAAGVVAVSTVAWAGVAASVVGRITKSKELSQIGMGLSIGAGVSSVASNVFGVGAAEGTATASQATAENAAMADNYGLGGVDTTAGSIGANGVASSAGADVGATKGITEGLNSGTGSAVTQGSTGGLLTPANPATAATGSTPGMTAENLAAGGSDGMGGNLFDKVSGVTVAPPESASQNAISQWWSRQTDAVKNRVLQTGAQAASGLFEGWTQEQRNALEREKFRLAQEQYNTSKSNANAQPVVQFQRGYKTGLLSPTKQG